MLNMDLVNTALLLLYIERAPVLLLAIGIICRLRFEI